MVTRAELPCISWEEDLGPDDIRRVSDLILATITDALALPADGSNRLFFVVPTPIPYVRAEAELLAAAATPGTEARELRVVTLPQGGKCYVIPGEERFRALLPYIFRLGPPELTFIAANCKFDLTAAENEIINFVYAVLGDALSNSTCDVTGMHFDSGDLVELF